MTPVKFPECNIEFVPPQTLDESQCRSLRGYTGEIVGGSCDGLKQAVVAYQFSPEELELLRTNDGIIFLSCIGSLPPHYLSFTFHDATHPA
jgi:hypothetical protein